MFAVIATARAVAAILAGALLLAACGPAEPPGDAARIDARLVAGLEPGDARAVGEAVNAFGFDLLGEVTDGRDNAVTSPLSVAVLLAMVLAGAGGSTAEAMAEVLHLPEARDVRVGALLRDVADTDDVTLSVANALWADEGVTIEDDYLDFVQRTLGATLDEADLGAAETARDIDRWVAEHTEGLIEEIADDLGLPDPQTLLVLVNAVYFLGEWTTQFDPEATRDDTFRLGDGGEVQLPLMELRGEELLYSDRHGYGVVRLPYGDDERYGMEVFLPDETGDLPALLEVLDHAEWRDAVDELAPADVDRLALPAFELEWDAELNEPLAALGMGEAFSPGADFRPLSPADPWLGTVVHKTYIRVDEEGTEAAAVTGAEMPVSAPVDTLEFIVDRPFAFTISDARTGTILFLGAVADPRG
jgi:serine protease inhibitor